MNDIVKKARKLVEDECKGNPDKPWLKDFYAYHMLPVVDFTRILVKKYKAAGETIDEEITELIAWLHDIGNIRGSHEDHHITGAARAEKLLLEWGYPQDRTARVRHGILTHRTDQGAERKTIEAECIARADLLAEITQVPSLFARAFTLQQMDHDQAVRWVREKVEKIWKLLPPEDKLMVKEKYDAIQKVLEPWFN